MLDGFYADFYGWDVVMYYIYSVRSFMQEYSWQVRLSYSIILMCILVMIVLMISFAVNIRRRQRHQRDYDHCYNTYSEAFIEILQDETPLTEKQILEICDEDEQGFSYYDGFLYAEILTHIRMSMNKQLYFPNLQRLCEITGAKAAIEERLKKRRSKLRSLQMVDTLPMVINEGLLSNYTAHFNARVSQLARVAHYICSQTEPYLYLLEDMNKPQSKWYRITVHRLLGWKKMQHFPMPPLLMLAQQCENPKMAAFLVGEISFWGTDDEKRQLVSFFDDSRIPCRIAAVRALARLRNEGAEEQILGSYESQPQVVRREMQKAIASFHSGKYVDFFANIYKNTPSHLSRQIALECLYDYCEEGRIQFEKLALDASEKNVVLFDQIRALHRIQEGTKAC